MSEFKVDIETIIDTDGITEERLASFGEQGYMVASAMWAVSKKANKPIIVGVILQKPQDSGASGSLTDDDYREDY